MSLSDLYLGDYGGVDWGPVLAEYGVSPDWEGFSLAAGGDDWMNGGWDAPLDANYAPSALNPSGYSLGGPELSNADILGDQFGTGPMRGNDFTLGVPGIDGEPMRPSVFEWDANGNPIPLGWRGADGMIQTLDGNPIPNNPLGVNPSGGNALKGLLDALKGAGRGVGSSGGGGGGNLGVSMPQIDAPGAPTINAMNVPAMQTGAIPHTAAPSGDFKPIIVDTPRPAQDSQGLARLFAEAMRGAR